MTVERYVLRPVAKDVVEFTGGFDSALEIATWMRDTDPDRTYKLDVVSDPLGTLGKAEEHLTLFRRETDVLGMEFWLPVVSWGHIEGFKSKPLTIETLEGTMAALAGYFIVRGAVGEFHAVRPDAFHATYRRQSSRVKAEET